MVSGSDQHGTPVTVTAEKEGTTPEEVAERYHRINKKAIEDLGIEFSLFTKTHTENHFEVVQDVFMTLLDKGLSGEEGHDAVLLSPMRQVPSGPLRHRSMRQMWQ